MDYIETFETMEDYSIAKYKQDFALPHLSYIQESDKVMYDNTYPSGGEIIRIKGSDITFNGEYGDEGEMIINFPTKYFLKKKLSFGKVVLNDLNYQLTDENIYLIGIVPENDRVISFPMTYDDKYLFLDAEQRCVYINTYTPYNMCFAQVIMEDNMISSLTFLDTTIYADFKINEVEANLSLHPEMIKPYHYFSLTKENPIAVRPHPKYGNDILNDTNLVVTLWQPDEQNGNFMRGFGFALNELLPGNIPNTFKLPDDIYNYYGNDEVSIFFAYSTEGAETLINLDKIQFLDTLICYDTEDN